METLAHRRLYPRLVVTSGYLFFPRGTDTADVRRGYATSLGVVFGDLLRLIRRSVDDDEHSLRARGETLRDKPTERDDRDGGSS